ncbi:MAG: hypothetical protein GC186_19325 [Rhodobacteraceae bacterium]|nr:hypothetical protein [Paracoccaceae bacterium]
MNLRPASLAGLAFGLVLAACSTPQERCIADATHDLTVVTTLANGLQADLVRGYGLQDSQVVTSVWRPCGFDGGYGGGYGGHDDHHHHGGGSGGDGNHHHGGRPPHPYAPDMCMEDVVHTIQTPVAIDLVATRHQLDALRRKQAELSRAAAPQIAQCQAQYPE